MAKDAKFGTFGGVFTPSILTILGVIMYLRLPWVVGQVGLYAVIGVILVAHVISVCTGLSISSIATDKRVGAGGPYYIVSRSLGLPIGGTLGIALFLGLSFSTSLYVIGFSESLLNFLGIEVTPKAIRICGTATLATVTTVTIISTALAIKTQYIILTLIVLSLASIFLGSPPAPGAPHLQPVPDAQPIGVIFGIFFPAVTGFTAGVNMSGDLKDPKKSIPQGTMAAIAVGLVTYVALAIYLGLRIEPALLLDNPQILVEIAAVPALVVAGIWGATLSSALGTTLGAPRILQAVARDRIAPRFLAKGHGKGNEPRRAMVVAVILAEAGILVAELDAIARIVSMVFLATYGFLNLSSAIESWASPDFRPAFRIPRWVSVLGAVTCIVVMIQLDLLAMLGATVFMAVLFLALKRRQLTLDSGDAWEGIWSSLVRSGLYRLGKERGQQRNWKPNILAVSVMAEAPVPETPVDGPAETSPAAQSSQLAAGALSELSQALITGNGLVTRLELVERCGGDAGAPLDPTDEPLLGVFQRRLTTEDPYDTLGAVCRHYGLPGLQPNTVMMDLSLAHRDPVRFTALAAELAQLDQNLLLFRHCPDRGFGARRRIDVWWRAGTGNLMLALALLRFVTRASGWSGAGVRFLIVSEDTANDDNLRTTTRRLLQEARLEGPIRIVGTPPGGEDLHQRICEESGDADLCIIGLPQEPDRLDPGSLTELDTLAERLGSVLFIRGSSAFPEVLVVGQQGSISFLPPQTGDGSVAELPELRLPEPPDLAREASAFAETHQRLLSQLHETCVKRISGQHVQLVRAVKSAVRRHIDDRDAPPGRPRAEHDAGTADSALFAECRKLMEEFCNRELKDQRGILEGRIEAFLQDRTLVEDGDTARRIRVTRPAEDFRPMPQDTKYLRRFKRRRRLVAWLLRRPPIYDLPVGALRAHYFERTTRQVLQDIVRQLVTDSHQLAIHLGKALHGTVGGAHRSYPGDGTNSRHESLLSRLEDLVTWSKERSTRLEWQLLVRSREFAQAYCSDIERLDVQPLTQRERRLAKDEKEFRAALAEVPGRWLDDQQRLFERALLGLVLGAFQQRFAAVVAREEETALARLRSGARAELEDLRSALPRWLEAPGLEGLGGQALDAASEPAPRIDPQPIAEALLRDLGDTVAQLPEETHILSDDSVRLLEEGGDGEVEMVDVPLRRLAQFLVEAEVVGPFEERLAEAPRAEQRALGVAQEVVRLAQFQLSELEDEQDEEALREQMAPVITRGIERLNAEIARLEAVGPAITEAVAAGVQRVLEATNAYDLTTSAAELEQHIRLHQGRRAVSGARSLLLRAADEIRRGTTDLLYRRSAGVVLARKLQVDDAGKQLVDRVLSLVNTISPRAEVVEQLPYYYRQLFVGQSVVGDSFWVGREEQLEKGRQAIQAWRSGTHGILLVTGERGAGKTALLQRVAADASELSGLYRVHPPAGGDARVQSFEQALGKTTGRRGPLRALASAVPDGSAIVIDDLELWWERSDDGLRVIDALLELIHEQAGRLLFLVGCGRQPLLLLERFRPISDQALTILACGPLPADQLKAAVTLRHASTGLRYRLQGRGEDELGEWRLARLFSAHFDYSGGWIGTALRGWLAHVDGVASETLSLRSPEVRGWDAVDGLREEWVALLVELLLHKQLRMSRLRQITEIDERSLRHDVETLRRMGLVTESRQHVLEVNPFVHHVLIDRFGRRGLIA